MTEECMDRLVLAALRGGFPAADLPKKMHKALLRLALSGAVDVRPAGDVVEHESEEAEEPLSPAERARRYRLKKRAGVTETVTASVTERHEERHGESDDDRDGERDGRHEERHDARASESLSHSESERERESDLRRARNGERDGGRDESSAIRLVSVGETIRKAVVEHYESMRLPPPRETNTISHAYWTDTARWLYRAAKLRGWDDDIHQRARALVAAFYASTDPRTVAAKHALSFLAKNPAQYVGLEAA